MKHCSIACRKRPASKCIRCGADAPGENKRFCSVSCYRRYRGETSLETAVREALESNRIPFEQEVKIGRWSVDFLVANRFVLEADGDYWHRTESVRNRDARRDLAITRRGYVVLRVSEREIKKDPLCAIRSLRACGLSRSLDRLPKQQRLFAHTGS